MRYFFFFFFFFHLFEIMCVFYIILIYFLQNDSVYVGSSYNLLENLQEIEIGGAIFRLPGLFELQNLLGGEGECVSTGYSLVENGGMEEG